MNDNRRIDKLAESLNNCFIMTSYEVVHIDDAYISSVYHFSHKSYLYTEVNLILRGTSYCYDGDNIRKENIENLNLILDTFDIVEVSKDNAAVLLLDNCELLRVATKDWYEKVS